jgi:hypothetical protein
MHMSCDKLTDLLIFTFNIEIACDKLTMVSPFFTIRQSDHVGAWFDHLISRNFHYSVLGVVCRNDLFKVGMEF